MKDLSLINSAICASILAGKEILSVYNSDFAVETKDDKSPLTEADKRAHHKIMEILESTSIPVLSEEGKEIPFEERKDWSRLWIVDPLDGTKEFVKRNGEFTVNIALIENNFPIAGIIYVPVTGILYAGWNQNGAYKTETSNESITWSDLAIDKNKIPFSSNDSAFKVVASRSHMSPETEEYVKDLEKVHGKVELVSMGSSLKICLVAEGKANTYPRFAPTMEWDTAAGQGIAEAAGKEFLDWNTKSRMKYNREQLLNNWFLVK
jgi:3'(2'), 5'-bisphosphate nucleotidase